MVMHNLTKLTLSLILISLIVLGLSSPVAAQPPAPTIYVDAPSRIPVSTEFDIMIWIRDIPAGWGMTSFSLRIQWDPNDLEIIGCEFLEDGRLGWDGDCAYDPGMGGGSGADYIPYPSPRWTEDAPWLRFRFHCLREGPALITAYSPPAGDAIYLEDANSIREEVVPEPVEVTIYQGVGPVGGISTPINKLEILTPYIALAGLIIAVSAIVIKKRK
jgi:hypothetical protein